ncbi:hypothetical protein D3C80_1390700 [compost metagenome]
MRCRRLTESRSAIRLAIENINDNYSYCVYHFRRMIWIRHWLRKFNTPRPRCNQTAFSLCRRTAVSPHLAVLPVFRSPQQAATIRLVLSSKSWRRPSMTPKPAGFRIPLWLAPFRLIPANRRHCLFRKAGKPFRARRDRNPHATIPTRRN